MTKKELIDNFVKMAFRESDMEAPPYNYMEIIHLVLVGRLGWTIYDNLDNETGNKLVQVVEKYLVEKHLFMDFGFAYGFSEEQLRGIGELMFSETLTQLDTEICKVFKSNKR